MFGYLNKIMRFMQFKNQNSDYQADENNMPLPELSYKLKENIDTLKSIFGVSGDIIFREFSFGCNLQINAAIIFVDGMTERNTINEMIMKPFMYDSRLADLQEKVDINNLNVIKNNMLSVGDVKQVAAINDIVGGCLSGDTVFLIDGCKEALIIHCRAWESRGVEDPKTEAVVRGPREGFCETISTNMALLRRKIKNPNFVFESMIIGTQTKTTVCIAYLKGVVNTKLIKEVKERLSRINTDAILESGYIEQFIEDAPLSIFPTIGNSEKPDTAAAKILEGRVAIIVDGTPFVLTVPMLFIEGFQSAEDYYSRTFFSCIIRVIRYLSFCISILSPAIYVMLSTFHQELIPTTLLFTMAANREGVPFPAVMEAALMIITFEILREAGVRLPRPVGQAVSIVGALVIGEAAVSAGLVSGLMVIVVSITAVSSFVVPVYTDVISILRMIILLVVSVLGIFGLAVAFLAVLIHLTSLRSFGSPYLSPLAPWTKSDLKDSFIRMPLWKMTTRPRVIGWNNLQRQGTELKPEKPEKKEDK